MHEEEKQEQQTLIARAAALLREGHLVAFPTETVYGLGADASNANALARIFAAKGRPADHPLIVHLPGAAHLEHWAREIPDLAWSLAETFWPGPLTLILRKQPTVPDLITGGQDTVGLRVPGHPLALALLRAFAATHENCNGRCGIAAPSANRFGRISPTSADAVREELGLLKEGEEREAPAMILDGGFCPVGIESTILDLSGQRPRILRPGHITAEEIEAVCGILPEGAPQTDAGSGIPGLAIPRVSGALAAHYAPETPLRLIPADALERYFEIEQRAGRRCAVLHHGPRPERIALEARPFYLLPADAASYAHHLYAALRKLDRAAADSILVTMPPAGPEWAAVTDRLRRAACGSGSAREILVETAAPIEWKDPPLFPGGRQK
ncbi:MAG: L-threonylcarbamoyladenylate synthase [Betaproteobacteria bacterium]|nr:L-threonylcarbamoyladenylate synthase [Betaproteobacteria bacterium]